LVMALLFLSYRDANEHIGDNETSSMVYR